MDDAGAELKADAELSGDRVRCSSSGMIREAYTKKLDWLPDEPSPQSEPQFSIRNPSM